MRRRLFITAVSSLLIALFALTGCGRSKAPLPKVDPDGTIVVFGDTLTYGAGASEDESYPAVLDTSERKGLRAHRRGAGEAAVVVGRDLKPLIDQEMKP